MGKDSFPDLTKSFHDLAVCMNTFLRELESFGWEYCLDLGEVSTVFQKKW